MNTTRGRILIIVAIALVLGIALGTAHAAKPKKVKSQVEIEWYEGSLDFFGDVHSKKNKCEKNRTVILYYQVGGEFENVGTDTTDHTGDWSISPNLIGDGDPFYASVEKMKRGKGDKKIVCKADDSPEFVLVP
jgi:hypothetical protein